MIYGQYPKTYNTFLASETLLLFPETPSNSCVCDWVTSCVQLLRPNGLCRIYDRPFLSIIFQAKKNTEGKSSTQGLNPSPWSPALSGRFFTIKIIPGN